MQNLPPKSKLALGLVIAVLALAGCTTNSTNKTTFRTTNYTVTPTPSPTTKVTVTTTVDPNITLPPEE